MRTFNRVILLTLAVFAGAAATDPIVANAQNTPDLSTLVSVLTMDDYLPVLQVLSGAGPFTVFAPTNAAFAAAGIDTTDVATVTAVLKYHVVSGAIASTDLSALQFPETLQGTKLQVVKDTAGVKVNGANVVTADVQSSNGVVHIIDAVLLLPPTIVATAQSTSILSTLTTVVTLPAFAPVLEVLNGAGPMTVFAPTDAAFTAAGVNVSDVAAVTAILQYHVIAGAAIFSTELEALQFPATAEGSKLKIAASGSTVTVDQATVTLPNVQCSNGVVHVVDAVLIPPKTIVENAQATPSLSTLVSVLTTAGYEPVLEALQGDGPFTVFAPTNDAFTAAGVDTSNVEAVTAVLKYHVIAAEAYSVDLAAEQDLETLESSTVKVTVADGVVTVDSDSKVVVADVKSSNGVVHVVDKVLMPPTPAPSFSFGVRTLPWNLGSVMLAVLMTLSW